MCSGPCALEGLYPAQGVKVGLSFGGLLFVESIMKWNTQSVKASTSNT